ncbi:hypothetical protein V8E51_013878 [Hyaloscypha variabilis]|jgi:hypothetical protein|uniref:Uncharacterized protein n=1 Tax=Hyaloscypha variabilis (strain UAMH 11265 / GT02V1 / F) TaxID=1149755 RepID=A0A2J6RRM4_HYAVF|nr:hypothetical protein L207DRAFT_511100 [Hyaloscypha variabilis F]
MQFTKLIICFIALAVSTTAFPSTSPLDKRQQSCGSCEEDLEDGEDACSWGECQGCGLC